MSAILIINFDNVGKEEMERIFCYLEEKLMSTETKGWEMEKDLMSVKCEYQTQGIKSKDK